MGHRVGSLNLGGPLSGDEGKQSKAGQWYRKAAAFAMNDLGALLGRGGREAEAEQWYRKAAGAGAGGNHEI
jgi:hypothetical protein